MVRFLILATSAAALVAMPGTAEAKKRHHNRAYSGYNYVQPYYGSPYAGNRQVVYGYAQPYYGNRYSRPYAGRRYQQSYYGNGYRQGYYGNGYSQSYYGNGYNQNYYGSRRGYRQRCGNGTTGAVVGGVAGALLGREVSRSGNRYSYRRNSGTTGAIIGGAIGALAGRSIARSC